jgi:hypothetical protein
MSLVLVVSLLQLVRYLTFGDYIILFFQLVLLMLLAAYFFTEYQEIRTQGLLQYVRSFYNAMDVAMCGLVVTIFIMHLYAMALSAVSQTCRRVPRRTELLVHSRCSFVRMLLSVLVAACLSSSESGLVHYDCLCTCSAARGGIVVAWTTVLDSSVPHAPDSSAILRWRMVATSSLTFSVFVLLLLRLSIA